MGINPINIGINWLLTRYPIRLNYHLPKSLNTKIPKTTKKTKIFLAPPKKKKKKNSKYTSNDQIYLETSK